MSDTTNSSPRVITEDGYRRMLNGAKKGGSAKVAKGLAKLSKEKRIEISRKGVQAKRKEK